MKHKAHYPVSHTQIKTFTASFGAQQVSIDIAFLGPIPELILIALLNYYIRWFCKYKSISLSALHDKSRDVCKPCSASFRTTHYGLIFTLLSYQGLRSIIFKYWYASRWPCSYDYLGNVHQGILHVRLWPNTRQRGRRKAYKLAMSRKCTLLRHGLINRYLNP